MLLMSDGKGSNAAKDGVMIHFEVSYLENKEGPTIAKFSLQASNRVSSIFNSIKKEFKIEDLKKYDIFAQNLPKQLEVLLGLDSSISGLISFGFDKKPGNLNKIRLSLKKNVENISLSQIRLQKTKWKKKKESSESNASKDTAETDSNKSSVCKENVSSDSTESTIVSSSSIPFSGDPSVVYEVDIEGTNTTVKNNLENVNKESKSMSSTCMLNNISEKSLNSKDSGKSLSEKTEKSLNKNPKKSCDTLKKDLNGKMINKTHDKTSKRNNEQLPISILENSKKALRKTIEKGTTIASIKTVTEVSTTTVKIPKDSSERKESKKLLKDTVNEKFVSESTKDYSESGKISQNSGLKSLEISFSNKCTIAQSENISKPSPEPQKSKTKSFKMPNENAQISSEKIISHNESDSVGKIANDNCDTKIFSNQMNGNTAFNNLSDEEMLKNDNLEQSSKKCKRNLVSALKKNDVKKLSSESNIKSKSPKDDIDNQSKNVIDKISTNLKKIDLKEQLSETENCNMVEKSEKGKMNSYKVTTISTGKETKTVEKNRNDQWTINDREKLLSKNCNNKSKDESINLKQAKEGSNSGADISNDDNSNLEQSKDDIMNSLNESNSGNVNSPEQSKYEGMSNLNKSNELSNISPEQSKDDSKSNINKSKDGSMISPEKLIDENASNLNRSKEKSTCCPEKLKSDNAGNLSQLKDNSTINLDQSKGESSKYSDEAKNNILSSSVECKFADESMHTVNSDAASQSQNIYNTPETRRYKSMSHLDTFNDSSDDIEKESEKPSMNDSPIKPVKASLAIKIENNSEEEYWGHNNQQAWQDSVVTEKKKENDSEEYWGENNQQEWQHSVMTEEKKENDSEEYWGDNNQQAWQDSVLTETNKENDSEEYWGENNEQAWPVSVLTEKKKENDSEEYCGGNNQQAWQDSVVSEKNKEKQVFFGKEYDSEKWSSVQPLCSEEISLTHGFKGLVNQAATCYLNSLLQSLFMTPEFRNALYRWEFKGTGEEAKVNIPFQLQKLFLQLQTTNQSAIETTNLTRSFGWSSNDAFEQHDIQELNKILFDALERSFKNTDQADLIDSLYSGTLKDYVKCLFCEKENMREEKFSDVNLAIKPFGSEQVFGSLEEALNSYVEPELMSENNQYQCEKCNCLQDAHKGLKFVKFPYLLTFHLKRFAFDFYTETRIKLNDRLTFPTKLDLNSYIRQDEVESETSTVDSGSVLDSEGENGSESQKASTESVCQDDEGIELVAEDKVDVARRLCANESHGPYVYELFSVMVHSGSALGGHYYAYIKDFRTNRWYCFDDQSVNEVSFEKVQRSFGGCGYSNAYSSANAYMLLYRQENNLNKNFFTAEDFPDHIKKLCETIKEEEEQARFLKHCERNLFSVDVYYIHPTKGEQSGTVKIYKDITVSQALPFLHKELHIDAIAPVERCRLVAYDNANEKIIHAFEGKQFEKLYINYLGYKEKLLVEIREENEDFEDYKAPGVQVKVFVVNLRENEVEGPFSLRIELDKGLVNFKAKLESELKVISPNLRLAIQEKYSKNSYKQILEDGDLRELGYRSRKDIYIECTGNDKQSFTYSRMYKIISRLPFLSTIDVELPEINKDILAELNITPIINKDIVPTNDPMVSSNNKESSPSPGVPASSNPVVQVKCCKGQQQSSLQPNADECISPCKSPVGSKSPALSDNEDEGIPDNECANLTSDASASEDSSLTSDSDRTLVGDPPEDPSELKNVSSPEVEPSPEAKAHSVSFLDYEDDEDAYFKPSQTEDPKKIKVYLDERIMVKTFKKLIQNIIKISEENFKLYRRHSHSTDLYECIKSYEELSSFTDCKEYVIKLTRKLQEGERKMKIHEIDLENPEEPASFLFETVAMEGEKMIEIKKRIVNEMNKLHSQDIDISTIRLRRKNWRTPAQILIDDYEFGSDVNWTSDMYVQRIIPPEIKIDYEEDLCLYGKRWRPSLFNTEPLFEFVIQDKTVEGLKQKLSELSGIPVENVGFMKLKFPLDQSVFDLSKSRWMEEESGALELPPISIYYDGAFICFSDKTEKLKELTENEKDALEKSENIRLKKDYYIPQTRRTRETGLKIYYN